MHDKKTVCFLPLEYGNVLVASFFQLIFYVRNISIPSALLIQLITELNPFSTLCTQLE